MSKIQDLIEKRETFMVSKENCPFCKAAKALLEEKNIKFHLIELEKTSENEWSKIVEELSNKYNHKTFPAIFIKGKFVGGYDKLKEKYDK